MSGTIKTIDATGRISLGKKYAHQHARVVEQSRGTLIVQLCEVIPVDEKWLHENKEAMSKVQDGLHAAGAGDYAKAPDIDDE